jgi:hypothetical protein
MTSETGTRHLTAARAKAQGFIPITYPFSPAEQLFFERAITDLKGFNIAIVDREIWRHGSEVMTHHIRQKKDWRDRGEVDSREKRVGPRKRKGEAE